MKVEAVGGPHDGAILEMAPGATGLKMMIQPNLIRLMAELEEEKIIEVQEITYPLEPHPTKGRSWRAIYAPLYWPGRAAP